MIPGVVDKDFLSRFDNSIRLTAHQWAQSRDLSGRNLFRGPVTGSEQQRNFEFAKFFHKVSQFECVANTGFANRDDSTDLKILPPRWGLEDYLSYCQNRDKLLYRWGTELLSIALKLPESVFGELLDEELLDSIQAFERRVRAYDPRLNSREMLQAARNHVTSIGLQLIFKQPVELHDSVIGYSMLYPYTDNVFDDPRMGSSEKKLFVGNLFRMLQGDAPELHGGHQRKVFDMVRMVYGQYPIAQYPQLNNAMLSIFNGQKLSLAQGDESLTADQLLQISMIKGGASVLVGAYLVYPGISNDEYEFAIGMGLLLQLIDDLEDMRQDHKEGQRTLFSMLQESDQKADALADRLFEYASNLLQESRRFQHKNDSSLTQTMLAAMRMVVYQGIANQETLFSQEYVQLAQAYSPFAFSDLRRMNFENEMLKFNQRVDIQKIKQQVNQPVSPALQSISMHLTRHLR